MNKEYTETEEKIFFAAVQEFGERGKEGARMQSIADRAGINKALIHYYFRSKDRLHDEVFGFMMERHFGRIIDLLGKAQPFENFLHEFFDTFIDILSSNPFLPRMFLRDLTEGAETFRKNLADVVGTRTGNASELLLSRFAGAVDLGEIRDVDAYQTFMSMIGSCVYFFVAFPVVEAMMPPIQGRKESMTAERSAHLFDLFFHGLKTREMTK